MAGLFLLSGLFGIVSLVLPVALVLGLIVVFALRGEEDEGGARAASLYLALVSFVGFVVLLAAVTALASGITEAVADNPQEGWFNYAPNSDGGILDSGEGMSMEQYQEVPADSVHDDTGWSTIIQAAIAAIVALAVLRFHWPRLDAVGTRAVAGSPAVRLRQSYCYVVCFLLIVALLVSVSVGLFNLAQLVVPDDTGAANRGDVVESFVPMAVLALGAAALFRLHWKRVDPAPFLQPEAAPSA